MKKPSEVYGWRDGDKFYISLRPRAEDAPRNEYATSREALREASKRGLNIVWDDPKAID